MTYPRFVSSLSLILMFVVGPALAGTVDGRIHVPDPAPPVPNADLYGKYGQHNHHAANAAEPASAGVVVLTAETPLPYREMEPPVINQVGLVFEPSVVALQAGNSAEFLNSDPVFHNVFSLSPNKRFDLGRYSRGSSKRVTFEKPGIVRFFCDIHPEMAGVIVITDSPYYAVTDADGRYHIEDVPPGVYTVQVWTEGMTSLQTRGVIEVPDAGSVEFIAEKP